MKKTAAFLSTAAMMSMMLLPQSALAADLGVTVSEDDSSATGYTVTFTYENDDATNVMIIGGFKYYEENDEHIYANGYNLEEGDDIANYYINPEDWSKDANLCHAGDTSYVAPLENDNGVWTLSLPLTGGTYNYLYYISYDNGATFEVEGDPGNVPYINALGASQVRGQFTVPYDAEKQSPDYDDWTFTTPAENEEDRGSLIYTSYNGLDDVERPVIVYLPAHYDENREEAYKVLYLSHGGGGTEADWMYEGNAGNIVDRLAADGVCEEFIVVTMNNAEFEWDYDNIFANTKDYLIPYMEENYHVSTEAADRAFAGLSMGGMTTSEMFYRDPSLFKYFGVFSGASTAAFPELDDYSAYEEPTLYLAAGYMDMALLNESYQTDEDRTLMGFSEKLDELQIEYNNGEGLYLAQGGHDWVAWPLILKNFVETSLWK